MLTPTLMDETPSRRKPTKIVGPLGPGLSAHIRSSWRNRSAIGPLCRHALAITYRLTVLGWWWLIIRATIPTLGLIMIFQHIEALKPKDLPYPLYVISGMVLWTLLGVGLTQGTRRMLVALKILSRIALPRVLIVISGLAVPGVYALGFLVLLVGGIAYYFFAANVLYIAPLWRLVAFPVSVLLTAMLTMGLLSLTSVLFLAAKDVRMVVNLLVPLWFYFTPIIYPLEVLPEAWRNALMLLNPMASLIELSRWSLLGSGSLDLPYLLTSSLTCLGVFWLGLCFIARAEVALPLLPAK